MPRPVSDRVRTSLDLSLEADDIRLWLAIVRYNWSLVQVHETAIRELGRATGYDPEWRKDPRNQGKIKTWLQSHSRRPRNVPILQGDGPDEVEPIEEQRQERKLEEVYA